MSESPKHRRAFEVYYGMGPSRSLSQLAKRTGIALATAKLWSRRFGWAQRVAERDDEVAAIVQSKSTEVEVDRRLRNKQIVQAAILTTAKQIAEGRIRATLSDLDRLIRLEAFLEGEADSRQEIIERDLRGKTTDELREMVRAEMQELGEIVEVEDGEFEVKAGESPE